ncbi:MAG: hypothetical protein KBS74_01765 [Clostridiales bacterium]|nr:hypothetical protein [Candidatus Cacconaster stercorequi]
MNSFVSQLKNGTRRLLTVLLAGLMALSLVPTIAMAGGADATTGTTKDIYVWKRVKSQADLPTDKADHPVLICWGSWYLTGSGNDGRTKYDGTKWDSIDGTEFPTGNEYPIPTDDNCDRFYTDNPMTDWRIQYVRNDSDNAKAHQYFIKFGANQCYHFDGYDDWDWKTGTPKDCREERWTFMTKELSCKYASKIDNKTRVVIFCNVSGRDTGFEYTGNHAFGYCNSTYNYDEFAVYIGKKIQANVIGGKIIERGQTLHISGDYYIRQGETLTICPGGTLVVSGHLYNSGSIQNKGTIVMKKDACITKGFESMGSMICSGSEFNMEDYYGKKEKACEDQLTDIQKEKATVDEEQKAAKDILDQETANVAACKKNNSTELDVLEAVESKIIKLNEDFTDLQEVLEYYESNGETDLAGEAQIEYQQCKDELTKYGDIRAVITDDEETFLQAAAIGVDKNGNAKKDPKIEAELKERWKTAKESFTELKENKKHISVEDVHSAYDAVTEAEKKLEDAQAKFNEKDETLKALENQIKELKATEEMYEAAKKKAGSVMQGEGDLIMMGGSRLALDDVAGNLQIDNGACMECGGLIISPNSIELSNSELHIRKGGVLLSSFKMEHNLLMLQDLAAKKFDDGVDRDQADSWKDYFNGLQPDLTKEAGIVFDEQSHVTVDGTYVQGGAKKIGIDDMTPVPVGGNTRLSAVGKAGENDSSTEDRIQTYENSMMLSNGALRTERVDGSAIETISNGDEVTRQTTFGADGSISRGSVKNADGTTAIYSKAKNAYYTDYWTVDGVNYDQNSDGISPKTVWQYADGGKEVIDRTKNIGEIYMADGTLLCTYTIDTEETKADGETAVKCVGYTYKYSDHTEKRDANGNILSATYTDGAFKGASYQCEAAYYSSNSNWKAGTLLWTVTSAKGVQFTCTAYKKGSNDVVVSCGDKTFHYQYGDAGAPYPAKYVGRSSL